MEQCQATEGCKTKRAVRKLVEGKVVDFCLICEKPIEHYARKSSLSADIDRGDSVPEALKFQHNKRRRAEMEQSLAIIQKAQELQELSPIELMRPENQKVLGNLKDMLTTKQVTFKGSAPLKPQDVVRLGIELKQITAVGGILLKDLMLYGPKWYIGVEAWIGLIAKKVSNREVQYTSIREVILNKEQVEELNYGYVQNVKYVKVEVLVRDFEIEEIHKADGDKIIRRKPFNRVFAHAIGIAGGPGERNPIVKDGHGVRMAANRGIRRLGVLTSALPQMEVELGVGSVVNGEFVPTDDPVLVEASVSNDPDVDVAGIQALANEQEPKKAQAEQPAEQQAEAPAESPMAETETAAQAPAEEQSALAEETPAEAPSAPAETKADEPTKQATLGDEIPY